MLITVEWCACNILGSRWSMIVLITVVVVLLQRSRGIWLRWIEARNHFSIHSTTRTTTNNLTSCIVTTQIAWISDIVVVSIWFFSVIRVITAIWSNTRWWDNLMGCNIIIIIIVPWWIGVYSYIVVVIYWWFIEIIFITLANNWATGTIPLITSCSSSSSMNSKCNISLRSRIAWLFHIVTIDYPLWQRRLRCAQCMYSS